MTESLTTIRLTELAESSLNTRKDFNKAALDELTASIKGKGVINPLLVRRVNSHFEIVAGARRFRAAKAAGLEEVPAIVRELTDEEAGEDGFTPPGIQWPLDRFDAGGGCRSFACCA
jgi:ParB family chromosome partitioning protein